MVTAGKKRTAMTALGVVLGVYFLVLPMLWGFMPISISAGIAPEWPHNVDMPIPISVSAWHENFGAWRVRFNVDYQNTTAHGPAGPFYPASVYEGTRTNFRPRWNINRFTLPVTRRLEAVVPFSKLAQEGHVQPGVVRGRVEVDIEYVRGLHRHSGIQVLSSNVTKTIPFELVLK